MFRTFDRPALPALGLLCLSQLRPLPSTRCHRSASQLTAMASPSCQGVLSTQLSALHWTSSWGHPLHLGEMQSGGLGQLKHGDFCVSSAGSDPDPGFLVCVVGKVLELTWGSMAKFGGTGHTDGSVPGSVLSQSPSLLLSLGLAREGQGGLPSAQRAPCRGRSG